MSNIVPFEQQQVLARAFAQSGLFGLKTPEQALALMALCEAKGLHPAIAVERYHIVQGKASMKADTMLAEFQKAGGTVEWLEYTNERVSGVFSHKAGGSVTISWDMIQAAKAGLTGKDVWKFYPRAMMRSRCISEGVRTVFPGVVEGVYTPEEIESMPDGEKEIVGALRVVEEPKALPALTSEIVDKNWEAYINLVDKKSATADQIIAKLTKKYTVSDELLQRLETLKNLEPAQNVQATNENN